jgi:5-methylcytosine-specific restriction endonuclease McrA
LKFKRNKQCNVSWGRWVCPYTGKVLTKASDVDIDHIVPLAHANATGGSSWPREKKRAFANDPDNLLAVDDATNQAKGDKGPDEWKPPRREYWPKYARKWKAVKTKYGLTSSSAEGQALRLMEKTKP